MSQEGAYAIKLSQLEHQCGQTLTRLRLYEERAHQKIREELKQVLGEYQENEHLLQKAVNTGRSPAVAALSGAQISYDRRVRRILQDELPGCLHGGDGSFSADQVEAINLYGEYAIDFAAQAMRYVGLDGSFRRYYDHLYGRYFAASLCRCRHTPEVYWPHHDRGGCDRHYLSYFYSGT